MESGLVVLTLLVSIAFYIFIFWLVIRAIRALEKIADNLWTISRTSVRSEEAIQQIADRVNRIADNENIRA